MSSKFTRPAFAVVAALALSLSTVSCAGDDDSADNGPDDQQADGEPVDDLAEIPPAPEGSIEFRVDEQIIPPGSESQLCHFLEPLEEDLFANALVSYQGKYGHHLVLFTTVAPEPPGTVRDCTSAADMITLIPAISSINFGLSEFPDGTAIRIPKGAQLVVQQHYVNTSEVPIRVRDGMHLRVLPQQEVSTLAGFYGISDIGFELAVDPAERTVTFECDVPRDMNLLLMGPHMHEWGLRFTAEVGRPQASGEMAFEEVVRVDPWFAEFRDEPPVTEWGLEDPLALHAGDVLRTSCVFSNTSDEVLSFPSEMCATYGYYFPAPLGNEAWTCGAVSQ
jgi:hypothetical protein